MLFNSFCGKYFRISAFICVALFLVSCSKGGSGNNPPNQDDAADPSDTAPAGPLDTAIPSVDIIFPSRYINVMTDADVLSIRGTASDASNIVSISVNSIEAQTSNDYAQWSVSVPLVNGANSLEVRARDEHGNSGLVTTIEVNNRNYLMMPASAVLDAPQDRLLIADQARPTIMQLDLNSHEISDYVDLSNVINSNVVFSDVALDDVRRELYVGTFGSGIAKIDLNNATGSIFSNQIYMVFGMAFDASNDYLYAFDTFLGGILRFDPVTGQNSIFSYYDRYGNSHIGSGPSIISLWGMDVDHSDLTLNGRLLGYLRVTDSIIAIDLVSGDRDYLSDSAHGTGPVFANAFDVEVNSAARKAYVVDNSDVLLEVDIATGNRSILSPAVAAEDYNDRFYLVYNSIVDAGSNVLYTIDSASGSIVSIDLTSGARVNLHSSFAGSGPHLKSYGEIRSYNSSLYLMSFSDDALYEIDVATGRRSIVSDNSMPGPVINAPVDMCINQQTGLAYVADYGDDDQVYEISLNSGSRRLVASSIGSANIDFNSQTAIACDGLNTLYLANSYSSLVDGRLVAISIDSGAVSVISPANTSGIELKDISSMVLDADNAMVLLASAFSDAVLGIDLQTGSRSIISDNSRGAGPDYFSLVHLYVDSANNYYVADRQSDTIMRLDVASGDREVVFSNHTGNGQRQLQLSGMFMDLNKNILYTSDAVVGAIMAIDMISGDRVIISK